MNPENKNSSRTVSLLPLALLRLALLGVPEGLAVTFLGKSPVLCGLICLGILALWFCVDAGPFRAAPVEKKPATIAEPPAAKAPRLAKVQSVSYLFCKAVVFAALFQARMASWH